MSAERGVSAPETRKRYFVGVVDQILLTLSNIVVPVALARGSGAAELGQFGFAFACYILCLGVARVLFLDPALVGGDRIRTDTRWTSVFVVGPTALGVVAMGPIAFAGAMRGDSTLLVLAACVPVLLLQDGLRYASFARRRVSEAAVLDGVWLVVSVLSLPILTAHATAGVAIACWCAGAVASVLVGALLEPPRIDRAPADTFNEWRSEVWPLATWLGLDGLVAQCALYGMTAWVFLGAGPVLAGMTRAAQILANPVLLAVAGLNSVLVPTLARSAVVSFDTVVTLVRRFLVVLTPCAVAMLVGSTTLASVLFADRVPVPRGVLVWFIASAGLLAVATPFRVALAVNGSGPRMLGSRIASVAVGLVVTWIAVDNESAALIGFAYAAQSLTLLIMSAAGLRSSTSGAVR